MPEQPNFIPEMLKKIQAGLTGLRQGQQEIITRLGNLETETAHTQMRIAELSVRLDHLGRDVGRIKDNLGLIAPPLDDGGAGPSKRRPAT
ncbi:MAG TPA: hypothetical protein VFQ88_14545 [Nevskiaceae bacterium]|nr:hypothetical protein [Nevskiaceae bacterium]